MASQILSAGQYQAVIELGRRGPAGDFDQDVMSELFTLGLVEVTAPEREVTLTDFGRRIYRELTDSGGSRW